MSDQPTQLDARRLLCPMPVIRVQNQVQKMSPDDILQVTCTDPGTRNDIPAWCRINGHEVVDITTEGNDIIFTIRIGHDG